MSGVLVTRVLGSLLGSGRLTALSPSPSPSSSLSRAFLAAAAAAADADAEDARGVPPAGITRVEGVGVNLLWRCKYSSLALRDESLRVL
jgi:hypothetical protein